MNVEQQGYTTIQQSYQHVGYGAAAAEVHYVPWSAAPMSMTAGGALVAVVLAIGCARRARARVARVGLAMLLAIAVAACVLSPIALALGRPVLAPSYYRTLRHLESATLAIDLWAAEHGRVPSPEEWLVLADRRPWRCDGWGRPFVYRELGAGLEVPYVIVGGWDVRESPRGEPNDAWLVSSSDLGEDAVFGTDDDAGLLNGPGDWEIPGRYEHGRVARQPGEAPR